MNKKLLSLFLAFVMIIGILPANVLAESTESDNKTHKITFVASQNVGNREYGLEDSQGQQKEVNVEPNKSVSFKSNTGVNYYCDGKRIWSIYPKSDKTIYVDTDAYGTNVYEEERFTKRPNGFVEIILNAGEHGYFGPYYTGEANQKWEPKKNRKFYVTKNREVDLSYKTYLTNVDRGWAQKDLDGFNKNLRRKKKKKEIFTVEYEKKDFTYTFIKDNGEKVTKELPAGSFYSDLRTTADSAKTSSVPGKRFVGWIELWEGQNEINEDHLKIADFNEKWQRQLRGDKTFKELWSDKHQAKIYYGERDISFDLKLVKDGET